MNRYPLEADDTPSRLWSIPAFFMWPREHIALIRKWWRS